MSARVAAAREAIVAQIRAELAGLSSGETVEAVKEVTEYLDGHVREAEDDIEYARRQGGGGYGWY